MELPSGTVTFLLTDVVGSTSGLVSAPDETADALRGLDRTIGRVAGSHGGARPIEQGEGDSALLVFASATDAVRAAADLQLALSEGPLQVRVGVHTGDARPVDGRYAGIAIHRCARLRDVAHGGQALISQSTYELVRDEFACIDLGTHRLRDLGRPERIYQLDLGEEFPPIRSLDSIPNNLPPAATSFIGRSRELEEIVSLVAAHRLVTIVGSGGCGKSRLALQAAAQIADRFEDGVWWIDLTGVTDPAVVVPTVRATLRIPEEGGDNLTRYLRERALCIVVDNCEHLLEPTAELVRSLLEAGTRVHVLATTREPLAVPGEASWRVPSMSENDGERLFLERARLAGRSIEPDADVTTICRRLDGIPLAIELAAARVRAMSPAEIATALDDRFRLLTGGPRGVAARQRTLEASVDWSHELLEDQEQVLFRRLSVFAGGFSLEGANAVGGGDVLDPLTSLVDRSLVVAEQSGERTRYRMLETIRQYAYERLQASGETREMRDRHLAMYRDLCERASVALETPAREEWLALLVSEYDNLRAALEWSSSSPDDDTWMRMVGWLRDFWVRAGDYREALSWTGRAVEATAGERSRERVDLLRADAWLAGSIPDLERHNAAVAEGLEIARELDDRRSIGRLLSMRAYGLSVLDPVAGRESFTEPLEIARKGGDDVFVAFCCAMIANTLFQRDRYDEAEVYFQEAAAANARSKDPQMRVALAVSRSYVAQLRGELDEGTAYAAEAVEVAHLLRDPMARGATAAAQGWALARSGDLEGARSLLSERMRAASEAGLILAIPWLLGATVDTMMWSGDLDDAAALVEGLLPAIVETFGGWGRCWPFAALGEIVARQGDVDRAKQILDQTVRWAVDYDCPRPRALALSALARIETDPSRAEDLEHAALEIRRTFGIRLEIPNSLEALARIAADLGSDAEAARLLAAAAAARSAMGCPVPPVDRAAYDELVARLNAVDAWEEGASLSLDEAVAYATRARGARGRPSAGWSSLTPMELDVVRLVSQGLTNPEIGAKLFVSRATVKSHLSHVYAKLGITSRAELAAEASRRQM